VPAAVPNALVAQIPGRVLKVLAKPGDTVTKGTVVLTLESMKMEIEIYAHKEGVIKEILVKPGDVVNAGDTLAIIE
jgi:biotin carboxyl carrier protein